MLRCSPFLPPSSINFFFYVFLFILGERWAGSGITEKEGESQAGIELMKMWDRDLSRNQEMLNWLSHPGTAGINALFIYLLKTFFYYFLREKET